MKNKKPKTFNGICEECGFNEVETIVHNRDTGKWMNLCGKCGSEYSHWYWIDLQDLFSSPFQIVDWISHLNSKNWLDAQDFFDCITRLRRTLKDHEGLK